MELHGSGEKNPLSKLIKEELKIKGDDDMPFFYISCADGKDLSAEALKRTKQLYTCLAMG